MAKHKRTTDDEKRRSDASNDFVEYVKKIREYQTGQLIDRAKRMAEAQRLLGPPGKRGRRDLDPMDKVREREWELILRQTKKQEKAALALLKHQRARQRQALRTIIEHRERFEYKKGNPHTSICLWRAAASPNALLNTQTFSDGTVRPLFAITPGPIRVGENIVRLSEEVIGSPVHDYHWNPVAALEIITQHVFEATVPHDGVLSVTGTYAPLGVVFLGAAGDLMFAPSAGADMFVYLQIHVETVDGPDIDPPLGTTQTVFDRHVGPSVHGASESIAVGSSHSLTYQLAHDNVVEVHEGDVVRVTAGFDLYIAGSRRGTARATFAPQPLGFNVPMVLLRIDG